MLFFHSSPTIEYEGTRRCHTFKCAARSCKATVCCFLDKQDATSTGNMRKHVLKCWGEESYKTVMQANTLKTARATVSELSRTGSITAAFERKGKGKVTYSHRQHTKTKTKLVKSIKNMKLVLNNVLEQRSYDGYQRAQGPFPSRLTGASKA